MLLTLTVSAQRPVFTSRRSKVDLLSLPKRIREELGLHGMNICTDLLAGANRSTLAAVREAADKARCACLLLIEPGELAMHDPKAAGDKAQARAMNILEAASLLGCNAAAIALGGEQTDAHVEMATERLKAVVERAESLEVNVLISPRPGMTENTDDLTALLKHVGGFRIGTFPDFATAQQADDPETYLRRLTPYASVVQATTVEFGELPESASDDSPSPASGSDASSAASSDKDDGSTEEAAASDDPASALLAAIEAMDDEPFEVAPHIAYDLEPLLRAVSSVGFDGTLALSYEGEGDAKLGIEQSRDAIEDALERLAGE